MFELNFVAPWNIDVKVGVAAVPSSQLLIAIVVALSRAVSLRNMLAKVVTFERFQILPEPE